MFGFMAQKSKAPLKSKIRGEIGYYGLEEWWLNELTEDERNRVKERFNPLGISTGLTDGEISYSSQSVLGFLSALSGWFMKKEDRHIAYKILDKANRLINADSQALDTHFLYQSMIDLYYKDREIEGGLDRAIQSCESQIAMAPQVAAAFLKELKVDSLPAHKGYTQLAIILEKRKEFQEAIKLCTQAGSQGWAGDWQHRISRCERRMVNAQQHAQPDRP